VRVAVDADGTLNNPTDLDEEWAVEASIPLRSIDVKDAGPGTRIRCIVSRCEVVYNGRRACGSWGGPEGAGVLVLE
jgi:hypothetical protein